MDFVEADVAWHPAAINAGMEWADTLVDSPLAVVPWRKPVGFARTENGHNRFAEGGGEMGGKRIVAKNGVAGGEGSDEGGKVGRL